MTSARKYLGLFTGVLAVHICSCLTANQTLEIDALVENVFMAENNIPGVGVTIVEKFGTSTFAKGYGFADVERNITSNENTKFCIASITKTFTATLVMKVLSEKFPQYQGGVLDVPLRILHPNGNFTFSDRFRHESMSFRDLLSHRHGIQTESLGSNAGAFKDIDEFTYRSRYAPEVSSFRAGGFYSNTLFALAGKLIAEIAQQPYDMLLQDFFDQLGMNESTLITADVNLDLMANMSRGYVRIDGQITRFNSSLINRVFVGAPAGAIITTSNDMAKYITFQLNNGRVGNTQVIFEEAMMWLREASAPLDSMQFKSINSSMVAGSYAMGPGFQLNVFDGWQYLSHNGQWVSFMSQLRLYPALGFGTFSVNNGPSHIGNGHSFLQDSIFAIVNGISDGRITSAPVKQHSSSSKKFGNVQLLNNTLPLQRKLSQEALVGSFGHPVEGEIEVSLPNGTLYFRFGLWATGYLHEYPTIPNIYVIRWDSDFVHDIYFGIGELIDIFVQFENANTLRILFDNVYAFVRGVSLETLPEIPWEPESCAP